MLRNTQEDISIPGNVFDCQHARRNSDELHNDSNNLATLSAILRTEGIEKIESEEPLQSIPISCFSMRARQMSRRWKMSCVCDWPCRGYWDLYSRHDNTELSLLGDASANFPWPNVISELDREFPSRSLHKGSYKKERDTLLTPMRRLENVLSGRLLGLVQEETFVVFATGRRETMWKEVERRKKILPRTSILFSTESEGTDWRGKLKQSNGQSCDWS